MLNQILKSLGFEPNKIRPHQVVYKSPFNPTERTPSFFVFPNSETGEWTNWKDYASGAGGDHYKFLMEYLQIGFIEAKEKLKEILGNQHHIEPKRTNSQNLLFFLLNSGRKKEVYWRIKKGSNHFPKPGRPLIWRYFRKEKGGHSSFWRFGKGGYFRKGGFFLPRIG